MTTATAVAANSPLADLEYRFSLERLDQLNRDPAPLLLARLTPNCPSYGMRPTAVADPSRLVNEISSRCADDDTYIRSALPLQEIVFRTLLLNGGAAITLAELHQELTERWSTQVRPITVTMAGLKRILDSDEFYGFALVPPPEPEPEPESEPALVAYDLPALAPYGLTPSGLPSSGLPSSDEAPFAPDEPDEVPDFIIAAAYRQDDDDDDDDDDIFEEDDDLEEDD